MPMEEENKMLAYIYTRVCTITYGHLYVSVRVCSNMRARMCVILYICVLCVRA